MDERSTARPSAVRENGVRPDPLSWSSYVRSGSDGCGVTSVSAMRQRTHGTDSRDLRTNAYRAPIAELACERAELVPAVAQRPWRERLRAIAAIGGHENALPTQDIDQVLPRRGDAGDIRRLGAACVV